MIWLRPYPLSCRQLSLFLSLPVCRRLRLLRRGGRGKGSREELIIRRRESLVLYKSLNTLCKCLKGMARGCIQRETWGLGPYIQYHRISQSTPKSAFRHKYKGKEVTLERSLLLVGHICIYLITANQYEKEEYEERGGKRWELTLYLRIYIL
jgi:hypothetical protein